MMWNEPPRLAGETGGNPRRERADWLRPNAEAWFGRQMAALEPFDMTATFCFAPEEKGVWPHHTAPPKHPEEFAEFCAAMVRRYAPGHVTRPPSNEQPAASMAT